MMNNKNSKILLESIGNTPLIKISSFYNKVQSTNKLKYNNLFAKVEMINPSGSIKDRPACLIINEAIKNGLINDETTIIEASSGNMGISLAMICDYFHKKCIIIMPENVTEERIELLKKYNASIILTDKRKMMTGSVEEAEKIHLEIEDSFYVDQFNNENNYKAHYQTGEEIYNSLNGNIDVLLCGVGSGGTITGCGKYLKEKNPNIKIIGVEPEDSPLLSKGVKGSHMIQGIGPNFIPKILDLSIIDEIITVGYDETRLYRDLILKEEGLFVGLSSGACLAAVIKLIDKEEFQNKNIVVILPDGGMKYLSVDK